MKVETVLQSSADRVINSDSGWKDGSVVRTQVQSQHLQQLTTVTQVLVHTDIHAGKNIKEYKNKPKPYASVFTVHMLGYFSTVSKTSHLQLCTFKSY